MQVNFDGGFYALYPQKLEPGATKTFDIRKIRDQQIPDSQGRRLPLNFAFGQIRNFGLILLQEIAGFILERKK
jgi:hypothetical protein